MRKILTVLVLVMFLGAAFSAAPGITQVSYNPSPAVPGSTIQVLVQVENTENVAKTNVTVSLDDDYPFKVKSNSEVNVGTLAAHAKTTVPFTVYIDPSAENTTYMLNVRVVTDQDSVGRLVPSSIVISGEEPNLKVVGVSSSKLIPGEEKQISLTVQNVGTSSAYDVVVELQEDRTVTSTGEVVEREILPLGTATKYVGTVLPGDQSSVMIMVSVNREADLKNYTLPVTVSYRTPAGARESTTSYIGFKVSGDVSIDATLKEIVGSAVAGTQNTVTIELFNKGAGKAEFVIASLEADCGTTDGIKEFIGTLEPNDVDSFRSEVTLGKEIATGDCVLGVNIEYQDSDAITKNVTVPVSMMAYSAADGAALMGGGPDIGTIIIVIVVIAVIIWWWKRRKRK